MINQRGDSGRPMINIRMMRANKIWSAIGKRHETVEGSRKLNPKSIQYESITPGGSISMLVCFGSGYIAAYLQ